MRFPSLTRSTCGEDRVYLSVQSILSRRGILLAALAAWPVVLFGCSEESPVGIGNQALPGEPVTVEVRIPWSEFASNLETFGGYGRTESLQEGVLALQHEATLDARTLLRFQAYPISATVRDSTGTERPDFDLTFIGGQLVTFFDRAASTNDGTPVSLAVGRTQTEWHSGSASWDFAVDTVNDQRAWPEPGGGPAVMIDTTLWTPADGDSAIFQIDSATIAAWADTSDLSMGARIEMVDPGYRLNMTGALLRLDTRPGSNPDTIIQVDSRISRVTFIYTPSPVPPPDGVRIGGAPSWRTILDVLIPPVVDSISDFCAVVSCPHTLTPIEISYAALVFTSRASEPAFQPSDSIRLDVRPVFDRTAMPKSPLGVSLIAGGFGRSVAPEAFGSAPGAQIEIPFTTFARDLLRGTDEDGNVPPNTLALLSFVEPYSIAYGAFDGPGSAGEPYLRLVLTIGPPVELP